MNKKIINAVRTYLIDNGRIVVIRYRDLYQGFYDIPGGKIEPGETSDDASIREFKEETGMIIKKEHYVGHNVIEYPDRIFEIDVFVVDEYSGKPINTSENDAMWISLSDLVKEEKVFSTIKTIKYLPDQMNLKIECDSNHNVLEIKKR